MSNPIDAFLDVDFTKDPHYIRGYDQLGDVSLYGAYEDYASAMIPQSSWPDMVKEMDANDSGTDALVTRIYNQGREGACVANACCQAQEIVQALQFGKPLVTPLSAISVYQFIGRSPSSGAMVSDGLKRLADYGACPLDTPENRAKFGTVVMPNTGYYTRRPEGWEGIAKSFRVHEWTVIRSLEGMMSALLNRHPVVVGRQGHSICYCRPMYRNGSLVAKYANSWGNWGDNGYGYDTLRQMNMSSGWAFACRSIVVPKHLGGRCRHC